MTQPVGWYKRADGATVYWNGSQWLAPAATVGAGPDEPSYVKRKSRTIPGIFLLLGAVFAGLAAFLPWVSVGLQGFSIGKSWLSIGVEPGFSFDGSNTNLRDLLLVAAGVDLLLSVLMLWTRRRAWGPVLRLLYAVPWLISSALCIYWWSVATSKLSDSVSKDDVWGQVAAGFDDLLRGLGIYHVEPAVGLFLWSFGAVLAFVGLVVPGHLYEVKVPRR